MNRLDSIRQTLVPPLVGTVIAIGLVVDWVPSGSPDRNLAVEVTPHIAQTIFPK